MISPRLTPGPPVAPDPAGLTLPSAARLWPGRADPGPAADGLPGQGGDRSIGAPDSGAPARCGQFERIQVLLKLPLPVIELVESSWRPLVSTMMISVALLLVKVPLPVAPV